jgi:hypothetical protein
VVPAPASGEVEILETLPFEPAAAMGAAVDPPAAPPEAAEPEAPAEPLVIADVEPSIVPKRSEHGEPSPGVIGAAVDKDEPVELVAGTPHEGVVRAEVERPGDVELSSARGAEELDHSTSLESRVGQETGEGGMLGATIEPDEPIELEATGSQEGVDHIYELAAGVGDLEPEPPAISIPEEPAQRPPEPASEPEPVVTETMAEVYVRQGLLEEARRVYRQLLTQRPEDAGLKARLAELVEAPPPPTAPPAATPAAPEPAARPSFQAAQTGGRSTRAFFAQLLAEMHAGPSSAAPLESVTPSGADGSPPGGGGNSLAAAFGASAPPAATGQPGGMSFDTFFEEGAPEGGAAGGNQPGPDSAEEGDFKNWLKGLKS